MLLLVEGEEEECLPKFGVLIFILAHEIKQFYSLSWKNCISILTATCEYIMFVKIMLETTLQKICIFFNIRHDTVLYSSRAIVALLTLSAHAQRVTVVVESVCLSVCL